MPGNADVNDQQPRCKCTILPRYYQARPEIGEHNEAILNELGFDPQAIDTFRHSEGGKNRGATAI
jgi:crotonobetainyl-CoA:carnitine CoA-transferase CaiB-like acyl-CoA transferase